MPSKKLEGHYENPIIMLKANIVKKQAQELMRKILELLPAKQVDELIEEIEERTMNSRFHMRLDKQELSQRKSNRQRKRDNKIKNSYTNLQQKRHSQNVYRNFSNCQLD